MVWLITITIYLFFGGFLNFVIIDKYFKVCIKMIKCMYALWKNPPPHQVNKHIQALNVYHFWVTTFKPTPLSFIESSVINCSHVTMLYDRSSGVLYNWKFLLFYKLLPIFPTMKPLATTFYCVFIGSTFFFKVQLCVIPYSFHFIWGFKLWG